MVSCYCYCYPQHYIVIITVIIYLHNLRHAQVYLHRYYRWEDNMNPLHYVSVPYEISLGSDESGKGPHIQYKVYSF